MFLKAFLASPTARSVLGYRCVVIASARKEGEKDLCHQCSPHPTKVVDMRVVGKTYLFRGAVGTESSQELGGSG